MNEIEQPELNLLRRQLPCQSAKKCRWNGPRNGKEMAGGGRYAATHCAPQKADGAIFQAF